MRTDKVVWQMAAPPYWALVYDEDSDVYVAHGEQGIVGLITVATVHALMDADRNPQETESGFQEDPFAYQIHPA